MSGQAIIDRSHMIGKFVTHEEQESETIRYWNERSIGEKMRATAELTEYFYRQRGVDVHAQRPNRSLVCVQRPWG